MISCMLCERIKRGKKQGSATMCIQTGASLCIISMMLLLSNSRVVCAFIVLCACARLVYACPCCGNNACVCTLCCRELISDYGFALPLEKNPYETYVVELVIFQQKLLGYQPLQSPPTCISLAQWLASKEHFPRMVVCKYTRLFYAKIFDWKGRH